MNNLKFDQEKTKNRKKIDLEQKDASGHQWSRMMPWALFFLFLWIFFFQNAGERHLADLPYSDFKNRVASGQVSEVTFQEQNIQGNFKQPVKITRDNVSKTFSSFKSTLPPFDDPDLIDLLEQKSVKVNARPPDSGWWWLVLINLLPWVLIFGFFIYMNRRMQDRMGDISQGLPFGIGQSKAKKFKKSSRDETFKDVAGLEAAKNDLREIVDYLKHPEKYRKLGSHLPKGMLFMGPPGSGKTLLARATAGEADVSFFSIIGSEFIEMFVGVGASRVRNMFEQARKAAPAIIFIDEIDAIGRARGTGLGGGHDEREQTLNQILSEMDGFSPFESVVVIAATNRPDILDPALTRPGRFDRHIVCELPDRKAREQLFEIHTREIPLASDIDLRRLSETTIGLSGADIRNLVNEASLMAGRKGHDRVQMPDFEEARDRILLGNERQMTLSERERKTIAYHESGHAIVAKFLPGTDPLRKVTLIPRGHSLGATEQSPVEDRYNLNYKYLTNRLAVLLAGRVAERLIFGEVTTGSQHDLKIATQTARKMVCLWGMSDRLGPIHFRRGEEHIFLGRELTEERNFSEYTAKIIDDEIKNLLHQQEEVAYRVLVDNKEKLEMLAGRLLQVETLYNDDIETLFAQGNGRKEST